MGADATPPPSLPAKHACTTRSPRDRIPLRVSTRLWLVENVFYRIYASGTYLVARSNYRLAYTLDFP